MSTPGTLYLLPNTLGLDERGADILPLLIPEAVQSLCARLSCFVAENAKSTRAFLKLVGTRHPLQRPIQELSIRELNVNTADADLPALLQPLLEGHDVGLISEAGVPAVADPGANLVRLAHAHRIPVRPQVGPSSLLLAVMGSGLNGQSFAFHGYLPLDAGQRVKRIRELEERSRKEAQTQLFIETPYRNLALLETLAQNCQAATYVCVATDLTLSSERIVTQSARQWLADLKAGQHSEIQKHPSIFLMLAGRNG